MCVYKRHRLNAAAGAVEGQTLACMEGTDIHRNHQHEQIFQREVPPHCQKHIDLIGAAAQDHYTRQFIHI